MESSMENMHTDVGGKGGEGGEGKKVKQTRHDLYNKYPQVLFNPV